MDTICIDFINSEFRDFRGRWVRDDLLLPDWIEQFLVKWGLKVDDSLDSEMLTELIELRRLLRSMIETLVEGEISNQDQASLNVILLKGTLSRCLLKNTEGYQFDMVPLKKDWNWVQAEIAASFAHLLVEQDARRLKVCANTHCRGVFYDESKSRTRLYCTPDKCANLLKARRFRIRHYHK